MDHIIKEEKQMIQNWKIVDSGLSMKDSSFLIESDIHSIASAVDHKVKTLKPTDFLGL